MLPASAETSVTGTGHDTRSSVESSLASGEGDDVDEALADGLDDGDALKESDALGEPEALADAVADGDAEADASDGVSLGVVGSATGSMALRELIVAVGDGSTAAAAVGSRADGDADDRGSDDASDVADEDPTGLADADALVNGSRRAVGSHRPGSTAMVVISPPRESAWVKLPHGTSAATRAMMTLTVAALPSIRGSARAHRRSPRRKPLPRNATATPYLSVTAIWMVNGTFRASAKKFAYRELFRLPLRVGDHDGDTSAGHLGASDDPDSPDGIAALEPDLA